ncbi:MAG: CtsR family transcriptional regulator [Selenomonadaceae bacterium]|nr:CtsR family transcriptional regulator [Selenomonadaceae bacterium]
MLNNKADTIEEYICKLLAQNANRQIELKRTVLADEVSCAPSQISYVLSTRFTPDRGFVVESRRGLGGYIRIARITEQIDRKQLLYQDMLDSINEETPFVNVKDMINFLLENKIITQREAAIVVQLAVNLYQSEAAKKIAPTERARLIRSLFVTLAKIT